MSRIPYLLPDQLSQQQRDLYDGIVGGKRSPGGTGRGLTTAQGGLVGPFNAWLYSPALGNRVHRLGEAVRFSNSLPKNLIEIAILVTARRWKAQFEWWAHDILARREGVDPEVVEAIKMGQPPPFSDSDERLVFDFSRQLLDHGRVDDPTYKAALQRFGEEGVVDLVCLLGYYGMVSMTLNVFQVPVPPGQTLPFPEEAPE